MFKFIRLYCSTSRPDCLIIDWRKLEHGRERAHSNQILKISGGARDVDAGILVTLTSTRSVMEISWLCLSLKGHGTCVKKLAERTILILLSRLIGYFDLGHREKAASS